MPVAKTLSPLTVSLKPHFLTLTRRSCGSAWKPQNVYLEGFADRSKATAGPNFSANHLLLLSRMEYRSCVVFLMKDDSTRRVYRLYDSTKSQIITSDHYYCVSGKVNSADKLYLVIESVRRDTQHSPDPQLRLEWTAREKRP